MMYNNHTYKAKLTQTNSPHHEDYCITIKAQSFRYAMYAVKQALDATNNKYRLVSLTRTL